MTKRPTSDYMEEILYQTIPVLDHGHIIITDYMGNEQSVIDSARVSYSGGRQTNTDVNLLRYLMRNRHTTPFEACEIKLRAKMPIFVARQWIRHRTASVNEQSARYTQLDNEFYIPAAEHIQPQSSDNKQGRSGELNPIDKANVQTLVATHSEQSYQVYQLLLSEPIHFSPNVDSAHKAMMNSYFDSSFTGIARELARMGLTLNTYTSWIWKIDLHNLLHFLGLRADAHAQYEIRVYAEKILDIVQGWLPNIYQAFVDYHMEAVNLSGPEWSALKQFLQSQPDILRLSTLLAENQNISKRERQVFLARLGVN